MEKVSPIQTVPRFESVLLSTMICPFNSSGKRTEKNLSQMHCVIVLLYIKDFTEFNPPYLTGSRWWRELK